MKALEPYFTVSDYLIVRLHQIGLRDLFTVPGDYVARWFNYIDEPGRNTESLNRVGCRSELEAGYAADAYARVKGIGCVAVTYGVGSFSLVNTVAGSFVERLPVIVISGAPGSGASERPFAQTYKILLHHATGNDNSGIDAYRDITVDAVTIDQADQAPAQIDRALSLALSRKRPVYIEIADDLWNACCQRPTLELEEVEPPRRDAQKIRKAVDHAAQLIKAARKPMLWAGIELHRFLLQKEFAVLRETADAPYVTSLLAKSVLSEETPGFIGTFTGLPSDSAVMEAMIEADLLLVAGDLITDDYNQIVQRDFSQMIVAYDNQVRIGDDTYENVPLGSFLVALTKELPNECARTQWVKKKTAPIAPDTGEFPPEAITFSRFFHRILEWLGPDMTLVPDESSSMYVAANIPVSRAGGFVAQAAWGSIGYAAPAGLGLSVADPQQRSVVFAGDGGFQMVGQTLSTMAHYKRSPIVFVMANGVYGIEQALTDANVYREHLPFESFSRLPAWNYAAFAESLGVKGRRVETLDELDGAMKEAKEGRDSPWLIEVILPEYDIPEEILRLSPSQPTAATTATAPEAETMGAC